jgi:hypothetical protein
MRRFLLYVERCHTRHRFLCLVFWASISFQGCEMLFRELAYLIGIIFVPVIVF